MFQVSLTKRSVNWKHLITLLLFSIGIKVAYLTFSIGTDVSNGMSFDNYVDIVKKNDAYWYETIANEGYSQICDKRDLGYSEGADFKQSEWAFFPFYPMLNAGTMNLLGLTYNQSALVWSSLFSFFAILAVYWFGNILFKDDRMALFTALLMFCFPFSFYYSMYYTEAVFLSLVVFSFICIYYRRFFILTLLLIPLTLVRPNGIIILIPLYLYFLEQQGLPDNFNIKWRQVFARQNLFRTTAFLSAPMAFAAYGVYQFKMTGYFFAFSIAQDGWYRELTFPVLSFFRKGDLATQFNSIFVIIVILYGISIRKKLPLSLNVFVILSVLLPLCSGSVTSMTRFVSAIFPLFMILSWTVYRLKRRNVVFIFILGLHFFSFYAWLVKHPISF